MSAKVNLFKTDADISKAIAAGKLQGQKLQAAFHRIACSIVSRMMETQDHNTCVRLTNEMLDALPDMSRKNAMRNWVECFLGYTWNKEEKAFVFAKKAGFKADLSGAINNPFWDFTPEPEYKPIADWNKLLSELVKKAKKDIAELHENSKVDLDQLAALEKIVAIRSKQSA